LRASESDHNLLAAVAAVGNGVLKLPLLMLLLLLLPLLMLMLMLMTCHKMASFRHLSDLDWKECSGTAFLARSVLDVSLL